MLATEPEILITDRQRIADDFELFSVVGTELVQMLPEGDDTPLGENPSGGWIGDTGSSSASGGSGGVIRDNVGLGTGGLY